MNNEELENYAAKAMGLTNPSGDDDIWYDPDLGHCIQWNPLGDNDHAFRLAVKLRLDVSPQLDNKVEVHNQWDSEETMRWAWVSYGDDAMAATRRAIVLTAAAIGKDMP